MNQFTEMADDSIVEEAYKEVDQLGIKLASPAGDEPGPRLLLA
ncbi:MAG: hypothetical protein ACRD6W_03610 [Nitrososphaerales archaeon]